MLVIGNSAYARLSSPQLAARRRREIAELIRAGELAVTLPFLLEAGYSARGPAEHSLLMEDLMALHRLPITPTVEAGALRAQVELARAGHHRVSPADLIIAAAAHEHGADVLHYDHHYDTIATRSSLRFRSEWLAAHGALD